MKIDDSVVLQKPLGPCEPGCEGIVIHVDSDNNVTVEITRDQNCNEFTFLLPPKPMSYYKLVSDC